MKKIALFLAVLLLIVLVLLLAQLEAQPVGTWKSHTSQSTVLNMYVDETGRIWATTEGGLFAVEEGEISRTLTPTEGMYRISPPTLFYDDHNDLLWLGYDDGMFEAYDPATETFREYTDIARATRFSPRGINQIIGLDDNILIATDFGLVVFDPSREVTVDTYSNLGTFPSGSRVNAAMIEGGRIYAATSEGVAVSDENGGDLVVPDSWTSYGEESGIDGNVSAVASYQGDILALRGNTILLFDGNNWEPSGYFSDKSPENMRVSPNDTYLAGWNEEKVMIWPESATDAIPEIDTGLPVNTVWADDRDDMLYIGTTNEGVHVTNMQSGQILDPYLSPGPYMNTFADLVVRDGVLASASNDLRGRRGVGSKQSGFYLLRNDEWENFNNLTHPTMEEYDFHSTFTTAGTSDYFFFGSWGRGIAQFDRATDEITIWNHANSPLGTVRDHPSFIVVTGLTTDRHDQLWAVTKLSHDEALFRLAPDTGEWTEFPKLAGLGSNDLYELVTVDSQDQLWIPLRNDRNQGRGLVVKRITDDHIEDGVVLRDGAGQGNLPHLKVNVVAQDLRGEIWIGTERGLARISFPQRVIDGETADRQASLILNADETADSPFLLRTTHVTSIAVNSANQKWIGTQGEGVWLIEEDGGRHRAVKHFTTENSPLISDDINSVAYDEVTGQVFFATDQGLISYTDVVRGSVDEMDELFIYPNPFSYNNEDRERVVIDELSPETTVRILTVDGRMVRRLDTRGGRVEWDVRDFNGERVSTGVYVIVSVDSQNDQRGVGKLVIVR